MPIDLSASMYAEEIPPAILGDVEISHTKERDGSELFNVFVAEMGAKVLGLS